MVAMKLVVVLFALSVLSGQAKNHTAGSETSQSLEKEVWGVIDVLASSGIDNPFKDFAIRLRKAKNEKYITFKDAMEVFTVLIQMAVNDKTLFESRDKHLEVAARQAFYEQTIGPMEATNLYNIAHLTVHAIEAKEQLSGQAKNHKAGSETSQPPVEQVRDVMDVLASSEIYKPFKDVAITLEQGIEKEYIESNAAFKVFSLAIFAAAHNQTLFESREELLKVAVEQARHKQVIDWTESDNLYSIAKQKAHDE